MATAGSSLSATPSRVEPLQSEEKERRGRGGGGGGVVELVVVKCVRNESEAIEKVAGEVLRGEVGGVGGGGGGDKSASAASHLNSRLGQRMISQHSVGAVELRERYIYH